MLDTISALNNLADEAGIVEPSLMNFCVTDGESVIATRYISSRVDEAASLVSSNDTLSCAQTLTHVRIVVFVRDDVQ